MLVEKVGVLSQIYFGLLSYGAHPHCSSIFSTHSCSEFTLHHSFTSHHVHQGPIDPQPVEVVSF